MHYWRPISPLFRRQCGSNTWMRFYKAPSTNHRPTVFPTCPFCHMRSMDSLSSRMVTYAPWESTEWLWRIFTYLPESFPEKQNSEMYSPLLHLRGQLGSDLANHMKGRTGTASLQNQETHRWNCLHISGVTHRFICREQVTVLVLRPSGLEYAHKHI